MKNTWIELHLDVLKDNILSLRRSLSPGAEIIFMVKANAYGHGLEPVAACAWKNGVRWFAVAHVWEAAPLRALLPRARILVTGAIPPGEVEEALRLEVTPVIVSGEHARLIAARAAAIGRTLPCHALIDTGMGRLGLDRGSAVETLLSVRDLPGLRLEGVGTHFASADAPDRASADEQARLFAGMLDRCSSAGLKLDFRHISNSAGMFLDAAWDMSAVRVGIHLYGYPPRPPESRCAGRAGVTARPVLQWKTRIAQIRRVPAGFHVSYGGTHVTSRPTVLGAVNAGYSDGYPRILSNRAEMLAGGRRCRVLGRVTMNITVIDLGSDSRSAVGDEVVLIGQQGSEEIWADELAAHAGTISYEILTGIRIRETGLVGNG
jgi:alanine racemase